MMWANIIYYCSSYSTLMPLATGLFFFRYLDSTSRTVLFLMFLASVTQLTFVCNIAPAYTVYNLYVLVESPIWAFAFYRIGMASTRKKVILVLCLALFVVTLFTFINTGLTSEFRTEIVCYNSIIQLLWVLNYLFEKYRNFSDSIQLQREPIFWFCIGLLAYAPTTYFAFVYLDKTTSSATRNMISAIQNLSNIVMYFLFTIGMYMNYQRREIPG